jgi:hypothetical protein
VSAAPVAPRPIGAPRSSRDDPLAAAVNMTLLVALGWDPAREVLTPDAGHRLLGYEVCAVAGCGSEAWCRDRLCGGCTTRRAKAPDQPLGEFLSAGISGRRPGERLCAVCHLPGTSRPAGANGLCLSCDRVRQARHQSVAGFMAGDDSFAPASPRPSLGICAAFSCGRLVARKVHGLCDSHDQAWRRAGRPELGAFAMSAVSSRGDRQGRVVLAGLPPQVVVEVLLGIQGCLAAGRRLPPTDLRASVDHLRRQQVASVAHLDMTELSPPVRHFLTRCGAEVALLSSGPENEREKDVWDLRHWGKQGRLSFAGGRALHWSGRAFASRRPR